MMFFGVANSAVMHFVRVTVTVSVTCAVYTV
jgi:hypothetical protein